MKINGIKGMVCLPGAVKEIREGMDGLPWGTGREGAAGAPDSLLKLLSIGQVKQKMPYIMETCTAGRTYEVHKYHSWRCPGKGGRRGKKGNPTSGAQWKVNQRKAAKTLRRLMNANFRDGDLLVRLDFSKGAPPQGSSQMQGYMASFLRVLRREYRKQGAVLKYIYVKEVGSRGGRHIHMLLPDCPDALGMLRRTWTYGGIHVDPLYSGGQYRKIAEYFIKYAGRTEETEGKLVGKRWYPSKNLAHPHVQRKVLRARSFRKDVRELPGYILEKDSVQYGVSEYSGYEYFSYTLLKVGGEEPGLVSRKGGGYAKQPNVAGGAGELGDGRCRKEPAGKEKGGARGWAEVAPVQPCQTVQGGAEPDKNEPGTTKQGQRKRGNQPCLKNSGNLTPLRN